MSEVATVLSNDLPDGAPPDRHAVIRAYKEARRAAVGLAGVLDVPGRRLSRVIQDEQAFAGLVVERGGEIGLEREVRAQAAEGVPLWVLAESFGVDYGLLWAWLSEDDERLQRYWRAQRGAAERLVGEVVDIADGEGDVGRDKLRVSTRLQVAGKYDRERFGERDAGVVIDVRDRRDPVELMAQLRALADANPGLRDMVGRVMEPVVDAEIVKEQG